LLKWGICLLIFLQVANELVVRLGNLFGFTAVMHGLTSSHVVGMKDLWDKLRFDHTNNWVTFEKKLQPLLCMLNEGKGHIAFKSTSIPNIIPFLRYFENPLDHIPHIPQEENSLNNSSNNNINESQQENDNFWFENLPNDSFDGIQSNMTTATNIICQQDIICHNYANKLKDFKMKENILEVFTTDFHLRLLYGTNTNDNQIMERYKKLDKIIGLLIKKRLQNTVS